MNKYQYHVLVIEMRFFRCFRLIKFQLDGHNEQSITHLEDLLNELFYILFSFFDINELYKSIFGLNLRFKNLFYYLCLESKTNPDIFA